MTANRVDRRLVAILAADMVGYSRLMGADEAGTIARQKAHRRELIDPKFSEHGGRIVKTTGDGLLVEFASVVDAVQCAVEIQRAMAEREADVPEDRRIRYRVGINLGDIVIDGDDILGDGVNVAARLEGIAAPGGVCISDVVFKSVKGKLDLGFADLGQQKVKNIAEPVPAYEVLLDSADAGTVAAAKRKMPVWQRWAAAGLAVLVVAAVAVVWWRPWTPAVESASTERMAFALPDKPSIAVLPFDNLSGDPAQEYFSDGMTEDIITALSQLPNLFVIARKSSFAYKAKAVEVREIAEALGVRFILEGSVRKVGDDLRINARLVDAIGGHHLWAERYDRTIANVFEVQDDITRRVIDALEVKLTEGEQARLQRNSIENPEAYKVYRQAQQSYRLFTKDGMQQAARLAEQVLGLDSEFAGAWGLLAWVDYQKGRWGWTKDRAAAFARSEELAEKTLTLDPTRGPAYSLLSFISMERQQFDKALSHGAEAIRLWPGSADARASYATVLMYAGQHEEAVRQMRTAKRLSPYYPDWYLSISGFSLLWAGDHAAAMSEFEKLLARKPRGLSLAWGLLGLAEAHALLGDHDRARREVDKLKQATPWYTLSYIKRTTRMKDREALEKRIALLRKAGLPE